MKISHAGILTASFAFMLLLTPAAAKAEGFNEVTLPAVSSINLAASSHEILDFEPIQAPLSKKEAELFLSQLGISVKQKTRASKWDPFKAARLLQTSA